MSLTVGMLAAVLESRRSGQGQVVEASILDGALGADEARATLARR